ncbi:hypothetical protein PSAB6_470004 [Paraburkholderia sabiae]|nr:hypothetical protein PSAB6_470004 [Paraburkholderia sabiae]
MRRLANLVMNIQMTSDPEESQIKLTIDLAKEYSTRALQDSTCPVAQAWAAGCAAHRSDGHRPAAQAAPEARGHVQSPRKTLRSRE